MNLESELNEIMGLLKDSSVLHDVREVAMATISSNFIVSEGKYVRRGQEFDTVLKANCSEFERSRFEASLRKAHPELLVKKISEDLYGISEKGGK